MSYGLFLVRAIVEDGASSSIGELTEAMFHGDAEIAAFTFLRDHYQRYGNLPSIETFHQNGIALPSTRRTEGVAYYRDKCVDRARYNILGAYQNVFATKIRAKDTEGILSDFQEMLARTNSISVTNAVTTLTQEMEWNAQQYYEDQFREGLRGITFGYDLLDDATEGAQNGDVIILAGRPGQGKSYYLLNMSVKAWLAGKSVLFVSMEMTSRQAARRVMGLYGGVHPDFIRRGELSSHGEELMIDAIERSREMPNYHFVSGELRKSVDQIDALIQELMPDIIYIDAGYLLSPPKGSRSKDRREKISEVAEAIKAMALARNRPVVVTVQMNRDSNKKNKKGKMEVDVGNLAESDVLGQIATIVGLLYKPDMADGKSFRVMDITKNRDGPPLKFLLNFRFSPLNFDYYGLYNEDGDIEQEDMTAAQAEDAAWG